MITAQLLYNVAHTKKLLDDQAALLRAQPYIQPLVNLCKRRAQAGHFDYHIVMPRPESRDKDNQYDAFTLDEWQDLVHGLMSLGYKIFHSDLDEDFVENVRIKISWEKCIPVTIE